MARHGIECKDKRKPSKHSKDIVDGYAQVAGGMVKKSFNDDYGKGTQNLVRHLAAKYPSPNTERNTRYFAMKGLYSSTGYVYMYIPEAGINVKIVATNDGYSGSSKDHYYWSKGKSEEASRLFRRERLCGCPPCLILMPRNCLMLPGNGLEAGTALPGSLVRLEPARPSLETCHTRNVRNPLPELCAGLKRGDNVAVRIAEEEEEDNPGEDYFVAMIEAKATKIDKAGFYSTQEFKKGDCIVKIRWYVFCPLKTNRNDDRFYKKRDSQYICCRSNMRTIKPNDVPMTWSE